MEIGERIKEARLMKGLTQEELGKLIGVQKSAIAKYENGRIVNIKQDTLLKIAAALNVAPFNLMFDEISQEPFVELFHTLSSNDKLLVRNLICSLAQKQKEM